MKEEAYKQDPEIVLRIEASHEVVDYSVLLVCELYSFPVKHEVSFYKCCHKQLHNLCK